LGRSDALHWRSHIGGSQHLFIEPYGRWTLLSVDVTFLGTFGILSVILLLFILARLSERLGSVERMSPIYRYYYVAVFFLIIGYITHLLAARVILTPKNFSEWLTSPWFLLLAYHLPLAIGVTIGLIITWRYWSWLVHHR
jgi:hypothetical protein